MKLDIRTLAYLRKATYGDDNDRIDITDIFKHLKCYTRYNLGSELFRSFLSEELLIKDKKFTLLVFDDYNIKFYPDNTFIDIIDIRRNVYVIENPHIKMGSKKYLNDLINRYITCDFHIVNSKSFFENIELKQDDVLLISHFYNTEIKPRDVANKDLNGCSVYVCLHDDHIIIDFLTNDDNANDYQKVFNISTTIYQTDFILKKYKKYFTIENSIFIPHNDFKINTLSCSIPLIVNNTINITTMCSVEKGYEMVSLLRRKFITYKNFNINISRVGIELPYYSESNYDLYIKTHNIHGFLYLTTIGETWGYSFTMAMNSGLPILYNNIGGFKERILNKPQYFPTLKKKTMTYTQFAKMLDYIIENQGKYNYYGYNTDIIYQPLYNKIFDDNLNVVIIPSKIYFTSYTFSYINRRSIYTPSERLSQLYDTIRTVRYYIPQSYIILIDNSNFNEHEYQLINQRVDYFINPKDTPSLDYYTNVCPHKSIGELSLLLQAKDHIYNLKVKNLFKISGRYTINNQFDYSNFIEDHNIFKKNINITDREYYYTCFYKIKSSFISQYFNSIENYIDNFQTNNTLLHMDLEVALPKILNYDFKTIDTLGITQNIGVWNDKSNI